MTSASPGGQRSASIAISSLRSSSHAFDGLDLVLELALLLEQLVHLLGRQSSPSFIEISSKRLSSALVSATPSSTFSSTFLLGSSCGSCGR